MTRDQIEQLKELRVKGYRHVEIAKKIGVSANAIRTYVCRHPELPGPLLCKECGHPVVQGSSRRTKIFCCDACREKWFRDRRQSRNVKRCPTYGKEFNTYGNKKYCSRSCYVRSFYVEDYE